VRKNLKLVFAFCNSGEIDSVVGNDYEVSVMVPAGAHWKWPTKEDKIFYNGTQLKRKLAQPTLVNARGHFSFANFVAH